MEVTSSESESREARKLIGRRITGDFCVSFFQLKWYFTSGPGTSFGVQAGILGLAFLGGVVTTQTFDRKSRMNKRPPKAKN